MDAAENNELYDLESAAGQLAISPRTFERHVEALGIQKIKIANDKRFYYTKDAIEQVKAKIEKRYGNVKRVTPKNFEAAAYKMSA